jgi:hypothetical protein
MIQATYLKELEWVLVKESGIMRTYLFILFIMFSAVFVETARAREPKPVHPRMGELVFSQKGGMLLPGEHSVFLRTNDEWTGFSTFYLGYRYAFCRWFNLGFEAAASPFPHVYLGSLLMHFKLFESKSGLVFIGAKTHMGYRYQDSDFSTGRMVIEDYLVSKRNGMFFVLDLTVALRFGDFRRFAFYYSIYPRVDVDFVDAEDRSQLMFSPGMLGFEFRFRRNPMWSFAVEVGYTIPLPYSSIPNGEWVNFPSLGNLGFYYRF